MSCFIPPDPSFINQVISGWRLKLLNLGDDEGIIIMLAKNWHDIFRQYKSTNSNSESFKKWLSPKAASYNSQRFNRFLVAFSDPTPMNLHDSIIDITLDLNLPTLTTHTYLVLTNKEGDNKLLFSCKYFLPLAFKYSHNVIHTYVTHIQIHDLEINVAIMDHTKSIWYSNSNVKHTSLVISMSKPTLYIPHYMIK